MNNMNNMNYTYEYENSPCHVRSGLFLRKGSHGADQSSSFLFNLPETVIQISYGGCSYPDKVQATGFSVSRHFR